MCRCLVDGEQSPPPIVLQRQYQPSHQGYRVAIQPWRLALLEEASMPLRATLLLQNSCPNSSRVNLLKKAKGTHQQQAIEMAKERWPDYRRRKSSEKT